MRSVDLTVTSDGLWVDNLVGVPLPKPYPADPQSHTPATWDEQIALMHLLWGRASHGEAYDKQLWSRFSEGLYARAAEAGYQRPAIVDPDPETGSRIERARARVALLPGIGRFKSRR